MDRSSRTFRAQGLVLRHFEYGEADRILTIFTLEYGKIKAIAKGVRKIGSRKAGHLEPFTRANLFFASGRDLAIITQAETIEPYLKLKSDLELMSHASYVIELLDRFTYEEGQHRDLYNLVVATLTRLQENPLVRTVVHYYEVRLLDLLGFRPNLTHCSQCGKEIVAVDQFFTPHGGGVFCPICGRSQQNAWRVSVEALKYFRHFQRSKYSQIKDVELPQAIELELASLIERYMSYLLERALNSPQFLRDITQK